MGRDQSPISLCVLLLPGIFIITEWKRVHNNWSLAINTIPSLYSIHSLFLSSLLLNITKNLCILCNIIIIAIFIITSQLAVPKPVFLLPIRILHDAYIVCCCCFVPHLRLLLLIILRSPNRLTKNENNKLHFWGATNPSSLANACFVSSKCNNNGLLRFTVLTISNICSVYYDSNLRICLNDLSEKFNYIIIIIQIIIILCRGELLVIYFAMMILMIFLILTRFRNSWARRTILMPIFGQVTIHRLQYILFYSILL